MKKIFYLPGMISALAIPVLFWYYGNQRVHPPYAAEKFAIPARITEKTYNNTFEPYRNWKYRKIIVHPGSAGKNQLFYISELKKLQATNERETGIEFVIGSKNNYQDFITVIDVMRKSGQQTFGIDIEKTGHLFAVHYYKDPEASTAICGGTVGDTEYIEKARLNICKPETFINHVPQQSLYILFGFLLLLNISMLSIRENFLTVTKRLS